MTTFKDYAGVARAPFLILPITLVAAGAAAAAFAGTFLWSRTLVAVIGLVALHMAVNILNEWSDMRTRIDLHTQRTPFSGGSGTLPSGRMGLSTALVFGLVCAGVGLAGGVWFLVKVGWVILPLLVAGGFFVLCYTQLLARSGVGEAAAGLGLGGLPVVGAALVQGGGLGWSAVAAAVPATLMTFNLLLLNEFPDEAADRGGGRRNLVILLGRPAAARVYAAAALLTPASIVIAWALGAVPAWALLAAAPSLLLAKPLGWALRTPAEAVPVPALAANVMWNLATNTLMAAGLTIAAL